MPKDWDAVATAIRQRLAELDMTQAALVRQSGLAPMTVRELLFNEAPRRRSARTLEAVSTALRWPAGHLATVLEGGSQDVSTVDGQTDLARLAAEVADLRTRVSALEANSHTTRKSH